MLNRLWSKRFFALVVRWIDSIYSLDVFAAWYIRIVSNRRERSSRRLVARSHNTVEVILTRYAGRIVLRGEKTTSEGQDGTRKRTTGHFRFRPFGQDIRNFTREHARALVRRPLSFDRRRRRQSQSRLVKLCCKSRFNLGIP